MCLRIKSKEWVKNTKEAKALMKVAERDIYVWKRVVTSQNDYYQAPFRHYVYDSPVLEASKFTFKRVYSGHMSVHKGIHSYSDSSYKYKNYTYLRAYIPKGTPYFVGCNKDLVSLCLVFCDDSETSS